MSKLERLLDSQQDCVNVLEVSKNSLTKPTYERRTLETVERLYKLGVQQWELIKSNHEKIKCFENVSTATYSGELKAAKNNMAKIQQFVEKTFPELLIGKIEVDIADDQDDKEKKIDEDRPSTITTVKINPEKPGTSKNINVFQNDDVIDEQIIPRSQQDQQDNERNQPPLNNRADNTEQIKQFMDMINNQQKLIQVILGNENKQTKSDDKGLRVPEISLPTFDGNLRNNNYKYFKTSFDSVISRTRATTIDKFALLRSKLTGNALNAINTLSVTEGNYEKAREILDKRFDNPRATKDANVEILTKLQKTIPNNAESILKFMQAYQGALQNLSDLGVNIKECNTFIMHHILNKLDKYTSKRFEDTLEDSCTDPTLQQLDKFMEKEYAINIINDDEEDQSNQNYKKDIKKPTPSDSFINSDWTSPVTLLIKKYEVGILQNFSNGTVKKMRASVSGSGVSDRLNLEFKP